MGDFVKVSVVLLALPVFATAGLLVRGRVRFVQLMLMAVVFLPWMGLEPFSLNILSHEHYRGDSKGIEVTVVDFIAVAMLFALRRPFRSAPIPFAATTYIVICWISVFIAVQPLFATFAAWKVLRAYLLAIVVVRGCERLGGVEAVLQAHAAGIIYTTMICLKQRYLDGYYQVSGTFPHQNSLGMAVNLIAPALFALLLSRRGGKLVAVAIGCSAVAVVVTLSRGTIAIFPLVMGAVYVGSLLQRPTPRKLVIGAAGAMGGVALMIKALDTIVKRFVTAPEASAHSRDLFEGAAQMMVADHPLGIGMNNFSLMLFEQYAIRAGMFGKDVSGIVHNIYWLTAAELGWHGLISYILLAALPVLIALLWAFRGRFDARATVLLGVGAGLGGMALHGTLEWIARQTVMSYMFWISVALAVVLARDLKAARKAMRLAKKSEAGAEGEAAAEPQRLASK